MTLAQAVRGFNQPRDAQHAENYRRLRSMIVSAPTPAGTPVPNGPK